MQDENNNNKQIEPVETNYKLFPVPNNGSFYLEGSFAAGDKLSIFTPEGKTVFDKELDNSVNKLLECLSHRESDIISCYFGLNNTDDLTLEEIGVKYNLTKERVRQIKEKALRKLRVNALLSNDFLKLKAM